MWLLGAVGLWTLWNVPQDEDWLVLNDLSSHAALQEGKFVSASPKIYAWQGEQIQSSIPLQEIGLPHEIDPKTMVNWMQREKIDNIVIREKDCQRRYPALIHLFRQPIPPDVHRVDCLGEWCVFSVIPKEY